MKGEYRIVWNETKAEIRARLVRDYGFHPDSVVMATYPPDPPHACWEAFTEMIDTETIELGRRTSLERISQALMIPPEYLK
jgi:hypothetical protein